MRPMSVVCPRRASSHSRGSRGRLFRGPMEDHIDAHLSNEPDLSPTLDPSMALENSAYVLRSRVIGRESQPNFHTGDDNVSTHQARALRGWCLQRTRVGVPRGEGAVRGREDDFLEAGRLGGHMAGSFVARPRRRHRAACDDSMTCLMVARNCRSN